MTDEHWPTLEETETEDRAAGRLDEARIAEIREGMQRHNRRMTDSEGDPGPTVNIDSISDDLAAFHWRWAADKSQEGVVWITEGGQRIAAVVSKDAAEVLARLRSVLLEGDCEDFEPYFEAIKALGKATPVQ